MNLIKDLEQRTDEWKQIRKGSIGGTRVKAVMAKNNLPLIDELIAEKHTELIEETFVTMQCKGESIWNRLQYRNLKTEAN